MVATITDRTLKPITLITFCVCLHRHRAFNFTFQKAVMARLINHIIYSILNLSVYDHGMVDMVYILYDRITISKFQ